MHTTQSERTRSSGTWRVIYLESLCEGRAERKQRVVVKSQLLLRVSWRRKMWKAMIGRETGHK